LTTIWNQLPQLYLTLKSSHYLLLVFSLMDVSKQIKWHIPQESIVFANASFGTWQQRLIPQDHASSKKFRDHHI
jgi:hypothetical protein